MRARLFLTILCFGASLILTAGCQKKLAGPSLLPVVGTVMFQGKPAAGAMVIFCPETPSTSAAFGNTDDAGRFRLTTRENGDGAAAGKYRVTVSKKKVVGMSPDEGNAYYQKEHKLPPPPEITQLLPARYGDVAKTPLQAEVSAQKPNDFQLDLEP
jgi:hypothetical protein